MPSRTGSGGGFILRRTREFGDARIFGTVLARSSRAMRIALLFSFLIIVLAGCGTTDGDAADATTPDQPSQNAPFDALSVESGRLFWNGVGVGQTLDRIERLVGHSLERRRGEAPACGEMYADPVVESRELAVQLSPRNGGFVSDSVFVPLMFEERNMSAHELSESVQRAVPALVPREGRHGPTEGPPLLFALEDNRDMVINIKPGSGFYLSGWGCID